MAAAADIVVDYYDTLYNKGHFASLLPGTGASGQEGALIWMRISPNSNDKATAETIREHINRFDV